MHMEDENVEVFLDSGIYHLSLKLKYSLISRHLFIGCAMFAVFDGHADFVHGLYGARTAKLCARLLPAIVNAYMKKGRLPEQALYDGFLK